MFFAAFPAFFAAFPLVFGAISSDYPYERSTQTDARPTAAHPLYSSSVSATLLSFEVFAPPIFQSTRSLLFLLRCTSCAWGDKVLDFWNATKWNRWVMCRRPLATNWRFYCVIFFVQVTFAPTSTNRYSQAWLANCFDSSTNSWQWQSINDGQNEFNNCFERLEIFSVDKIDNNKKKTWIPWRAWTGHELVDNKDWKHCRWRFMVK